MSTYLWQNFLVDTKVKRYIAEHILDLYQERNCSSLVEIWPGKGAITQKIHTFSDNFVVVEKDELLIPHLSAQQQQWVWDIQHILHEDILTVDEHQLLALGCVPQETLVIGNLPYYITSPILRKFFWGGRQHYQAGFFMMQHEVGEKIKTDAKKKSYLWWVLNYAYHITYCKTVPAKAFSPAPKVKSCLIQCTPKLEIPDLDFEKLLQFLDDYSPFSRKTLWAIQKLHEKKAHTTFIIPEFLKKRRLESLSWWELCCILSNV